LIDVHQGDSQLIYDSIPAIEHTANLEKTAFASEWVWIPIPQRHPDLGIKQGNQVS